MLFIFSQALRQRPPFIQLKKKNTGTFEAPLTQGGPGAMKQPLAAPGLSSPRVPTKHTYLGVWASSTR